MSYLLEKKKGYNWSSEVNTINNVHISLGKRSKSVKCHNNFFFEGSTEGERIPHLVLYIFFTVALK